MEITGSSIRNLTFHTFELDGELGKFFGKLERYKLAIALTGDSGAGKSNFSFRICRIFMERGFRIKYYSLEEGIGALTKQKVLDNKLESDNFSITDTGTMDTLRTDAQRYDLIAVDSFGKLTRDPKEFDGLRQEFPDTVFLCIFQKTTDGKVRGGSSIVFDSSATIDVVEVRDTEKKVIDRVATMKKGRYGTSGWVYSIMQDKIIKRG